uniref:Uncharacterized protein n=1 Tax=Malurus cyaneus samueli TaxID=2593467 RepID=A0A8C5U368_9PASS
MAALTELERAIESIVTVALTAAPSRHPRDFCQELPRRPPSEEKIAILDWNNDEELAFGEYWRLIRELARAMRRDKAAK